MSGVIEQTPMEVIDWSIDWSKRGLGTDTIASSVWSASASVIILTSSSNNATTTTIWLSGGIPGNIYQITNSVVTAAGRTMQETIPYVCIPQRII